MGWGERKRKGKQDEVRRRREEEKRLGFWVCVAPRYSGAALTTSFHFRKKGQVKRGESVSLENTKTYDRTLSQI